jgi:site-specific DNA-cytosine methylase
VFKLVSDRSFTGHALFLSTHLKQDATTFFLENVKNLLNHDKGRTFQVILDTLRTELGYTVDFRVVDGANFVPQHRERLLNTVHRCRRKGR